MPSPSAVKCGTDSNRASIIRRTATDPVRNLPPGEKQVLYGASLLAGVAAWDSYINGLVRDFYAVTGSPLSGPVSPHLALARSMADSLLDRFNTPNSENVRNLLIATTGYDPWADWFWPAAGLNSLSIRSRLNEIVRARHSVAHGFALPAYAWTQSPTGVVRLTSSRLEWNEAFFRNLVIRSDSGMRNHILVQFGINPYW